MAQSLKMFGTSNYVTVPSLMLLLRKEWFTSNLSHISWTIVNNYLKLTPRSKNSELKHYQPPTEGNILEKVQWKAIKSPNSWDSGQIHLSPLHEGIDYLDKLKLDKQNKRGPLTIFTFSVATMRERGEFSCLQYGISTLFVTIFRSD